MCSSNWWRRRPVHAGYVSGFLPSCRKEGLPQSLRDSSVRSWISLIYIYTPCGGHFIQSVFKSLFSLWMTAVRFKPSTQPVWMPCPAHLIIQGIKLPPIKGLSSYPNCYFFLLTTEMNILKIFNILWACCIMYLLMVQYSFPCLVPFEEALKSKSVSRWKTSK